MPNCCGAIDGKHIAIKKPGSLYFNYKKFFSFVLMAVVDAHLFVDIGQPSCDSVGGIRSNTDISYAVDCGEAGFPLNRKLPGTEDDPNAPELPFFRVGDDAFGLKPWLMKPYPFRGMDNKQRVCI